MDDCIFCKIAKGEISSAKIFEDDNFLSFLDIAPANHGHSLVIPKEHFETLEDIPPDRLQALITLVQQIAKAVMKATNADGFNVFANNKKPAGQIVPHLHFHIVPRFNDDGINFDWPQRKYAEGEIDKVKEKITQHL